MYIRWQLARTLPKAYKFYGVSESCLDAVDRNWRKQPELFSVIKNGVLFPELIQDQKTARSTLGLPLDRPCVLHIGSFKYQKNHLGLLRIHRYLLEHHPDALLVLVGSGSLRREIEAEVHSSNLENSVVFMGEQRDVWPFYAAADTFLLPSFFEGMPNVLIEALGAGVPIVASRIPEHCEIVPHSQWDFLFPLPEYKQAAAMIASRLTAPRSADRTNFGTGNTIREAFSMESHINALESLYSGCSRRNPGIAA
jgi:glycosyltransferase involved in cell wall biosynthesis